MKSRFLSLDAMQSFFLALRKHIFARLFLDIAFLRPGICLCLYILHTILYSCLILYILGKTLTPFEIILGKKCLTLIETFEMISPIKQKLFLNFEYRSIDRSFLMLRNLNAS